MSKLYEKYSWIRDDLTYAGPIGNKVQFKGVALYPTVSGNQREYIDEELRASARTLVGKPVTLNHDMGQMLGTVRWAEHEDGRIEYVMELKDPEYIDKLRDKARMNRDDYVYKWGKEPVYGVSVEANYRYHDEACSDDGICKVTPYGIIFNALSLVEDPEVPGVKGTTIELMEKLHEQSLQEAQIIELLLQDHVMWHRMPKELAESYNNKVVSKMVKKQEKKVKESKHAVVKHSQVIAHLPPENDPRAQFIMEQDEHGCGPDEHWDGEKCVPNAAEQEDHGCAEDEVWDADQGKCVKKTAEQEDHGCGENEHWSAEKGKCVPNEATEQEGLPTEDTVATGTVPEESEDALEAPTDEFSDEDKPAPIDEPATPAQVTAPPAPEPQTTEMLKELLKRVTKIERRLDEKELSEKHSKADLDSKLEEIEKSMLAKMGFKLAPIVKRQNHIVQIQEKLKRHASNTSAYLKQDGSLQKRQCSTLGKLKEAVKSLPKQLKEALLTLREALITEVKHMISEAMNTLRTEFNEKLADVDKANKNLLALEQKFKEHQAKTQKTAKETLGTDQKINKLVKKLEEQAGDIATLKTRVKPTFKSPTQPPEQEPVEEVVPTRQT